MIIFLLLLCTNFLSASINTEVSYSRACAAGMCGDWKQAQDQMSSLVIDEPDRPDLLYDNGVAAFRLQEFEKAQAYFSGVIKNDTAHMPLKKQAHFNLGNTQVALNELPEAIKEYEAVLEIDPNDERAKHNLEKVRALLAQQEQQKEEQQNQDGDSGDSQQDQQGDSQQQDSQSKDGSQKNESNGQSGNQTQNDSGEQKKDGESNADQQGNQEDQSDSKSAGQNQDKQEDQFGNGHEDSPQEDDEQKSDAHNVASQQQKKQSSQPDDDEDGASTMQADDSELDKDRREQENKQFQKKFAPNEQWMARMLQRRDKADDQANKQLIKATVDKNMVGKNGQNNW